MTTTVASPAKKQVVADFAELIKEYPIVGALNMEGLPARQLQNMREQLREQCVIRMTKRRLIKVAFEQAKKDKAGIEGLEEHLRGMPALLFTKENPFTLFKTLKKNKSPAPAKGGQIAPFDIKIPAGPTPFAPGPIIGELGAFGLKTGVENGKVAVKEDKVVVKEGEEISAELAGLLTRLEIQPMEVGLDLVAVFEEGQVITRKVLDIDEDQYLADITSAAAGAMNLALNAAIVTADTTETLVSMAGTNALNLAVEANFLTAETSEIKLAEAAAHLQALASHLPEEALSEELKAQAAAAPVAEAAPQALSEPAADKPKDDKPEKDDDSGGDAAAGMGALFG